MYIDRVLSGMRPTGRLHLGHYHGVLRNWVRLQHEHPCFFFVADWHAVTTHHDSTEIVGKRESKSKPGTGIVDFEAHAKAIAKAGIYDFAIHHDQILQPVVVRHWGIESLEGLTPEAEQARAALLKRIERRARVQRLERLFVLTTRTEVAVRHLPDEVYWGKAIEDERYLLISRN